MPEAQFSDYNPRDYPAVAVTVDMAVFTIRDSALRVLLVERGEEPFKGAWALPGGFVRPDEDLDAAAARELKEETGVTRRDAFLEQLGSYGSPRRDPRMRVITVAYWAVCPALARPTGGGDATRAELVLVSRVEDRSIDLAFDHNEILGDALERLRSKLEYTALGARFCPPTFTISELRRVYEAVWNTTLDPGNFQRNVRRSGSFEQARSGHALTGRRVGRPASVWSTRGRLSSPGRPLATRHRSRGEDRG
ncbi:MAG: NUDIX domain-containing protein [Bryobacterales bacterium]|nr:NUDIX domain-containing protein [Bryobacterales bacterium]